MSKIDDSAVTRRKKLTLEDRFSLQVNRGRAVVFSPTYISGISISREFVKLGCVRVPQKATIKA